MCDACGVICHNSFSQAEGLTGFFETSDTFDTSDTLRQPLTMAEGPTVDVPGDVSSMQTIAPGEIYTGTFDMPGDNDFIRVELEAGMYYAWDLDGPVAFNADIGRDEERGFVRIQDGEGNVLTPNWRDVYFAPETSGTYFLDVFSKVKDGSEGDYTLEMLQPTGASDLLRSIRTFNTVDDPQNITVAFDTSDASGEWAPAARAAFEQAYDIIESVIDVNITTTTDEANADWLLRVKTTDSTTSNFDLPGYLDKEQQVGNFAAFRIAAVVEDAENGRDGVDPVMMGHFLHELGHALGLSHTHDRSFGALRFEGVERSQDLGAFDLNQKIWSIMSYNGREPGNNTLAALDIAALQDMYGANDSKEGAYGTRYYLSADPDACEGITTIWDTAGQDVISAAAGTEFDVTIDLRPASLQYREGGGGFLSSRTLEEGETFAPSGFTIANGVDIEQAIGGKGDDFLTGHNGKNLLRGMDGDDSLRGLDGRDTLLGDEGNDILDGGAGPDLMRGGRGYNLFYVDHEKDEVFGAGKVITTADFKMNHGIEVIEARGEANIRVVSDYLHINTELSISGNVGDNLIIIRGGTVDASGGGGADQFFIQEDRPHGIDDATRIDLTIHDFDADDMLVFEDESLFLGSSSTYFRTMTAAQGRDLMRRGIVDYDPDEQIIRITADDGEYTDEFTIRLGPDAEITYDQILLF